MENVIKLILGLVFIVFVAWLGLEISNQASNENYIRLSENLAQVEAGNEVIAKKNELLRVKIEALREDPRAIERKVRDELGLVRPDEIVVFMRDEKGRISDWGNPGRRLVETGEHEDKTNVSAEEEPVSEDNGYFDNTAPSEGAIEDEALAEPASSSTVSE